MYENRLNIIRNSFIEAARIGPGEIWKVYDAIMESNGLDWVSLACISSVSAELWRKNVDCGNEDYIAIFQAINEMVIDHANRNASDLNNYALFKKHYKAWISEAL